MRVRGRSPEAVDEVPRTADPNPTVRAGKRSNDEYRQISAYIRKDTHRRVKIALLEQDREFSELVEELLGEWLESRT
jgi:hypothetical protein